MWLELSDGAYFFGPGGVTAIKEIDLRDKPDTYIYKTELYANNLRVGLVKETAEFILNKIGETKE